MITLDISYTNYRTIDRDYHDNSTIQILMPLMSFKQYHGLTAIGSEPPPPPPINII